MKAKKWKWLNYDLPLKCQFIDDFLVQLWLSVLFPVHTPAKDVVVLFNVIMYTDTETMGTLVTPPLQSTSCLREKSSTVTPFNFQVKLGTPRPARWQDPGHQRLGWRELPVVRQHDGDLHGRRPHQEGQQVHCEHE